MQSCVQTHQILLASFEIFHSSMCMSSRHLHIPHTHHTWHLNQGCHHNQSSTLIEIQALVSKEAMQHTVNTVQCNSSYGTSEKHTPIVLQQFQLMDHNEINVQAFKQVCTYVRMNTYAYVFRNDNRMHRQSCITQISACRWQAPTTELFVLLCCKTCSCRVSPQSIHVSLPV